MPVSLFLSTSFDVAWQDLLLPWFKKVGRVSWQERLPTLVVAPFRSQAYAMKGRLLEAGISLLGVRFISPAELREWLTVGNANKLALREHLRLLLSVAAEECLELPADPALREKRMLESDFLAAKSVMRAPDHLLRTIDQLGAAGWDFSEVELPALRDIVTRFHQRVVDCGFELVHAADRRVLDQAGGGPPVFSNILVAGFNGAHWPLWPLLRAAVVSAQAATVLLDDPRDEARDLDETWVDTWEEIFGETQPVCPSTKRTGGSLFTENEMQGFGVASPQRSFLVGSDTTEQARAVAYQCLQFLGEPNCDHIGIIFSGPGALPRLVAHELSRLEVFHHDGLAHFAPGPFEEPTWRAWLQLQNGPRINALLQFVNALPEREELFPDIKPEFFERMVRDAYSQVLIDDLEIMERFCGQGSDEQKKASAILNSVAILPARARLTDFLRATKAALDQFNWKTHWMEISRSLGAWTDKLSSEFSRGLYLRWLNEIAVTFTAEHDPEGDHPYARVHLLTVPQANGEEWSHLIFAGWNEGSWPPRETGEFARQDEIDTFNRSVQKLNRRASRRGQHGEGHTAVHENHTLYLGPMQQRQIALRQFEALVESAKEQIAFTASLVQEDAPERLWNPNELFTRHYQEACNRPLTQSAMIDLQAATRSWLDQPRGLKKTEPQASRNVESTRRAYDARRDPNVSSGEYDFAFRSTPTRVPPFSVTEFEQLMAAPALVWLKKYLGVKAVDESRNVWNSSTGKWVHNWLASIAAGSDKIFVRLPEPGEIECRIRDAAEAKLSEVEKLCQGAGKSIPDWWTGGWRNAVFLTRALAEKLAAVTDWPWIAAEWSIDDHDFAVKLTDRDALLLRGRIDLLLAREKPPAGSLAVNELWIVDYKTGAKKELTNGRPDAEGRRPAVKKKLLDGSALQLGLYALAATALEAGRIEVSLLSPIIRQLEPQMSSADFSSETEIFAELARMQQTGVFGMHGPLRSAYRFMDAYPLATVAVDPDVLEQRWELTHPALVRDEEEMFW